MKRNLVYKDKKSNKFWNIEVSDKSFTVTFGRVGTKGQSNTTTFESKDKCKNEAEKLIQQKLKKGYKDAEGEKVTPPKKTIFDFDSFEKEHNLKFPKRYKDFFTTGECEKYSGLYVSGLPHYSSDTRFKVEFMLPDFDLFVWNDISREDHPEWIPLSPLGEEPQFLAVDITKKECPVAMWEHEDGMFHAHSKSLDEFLARLVKKEEKTSKQKFMDTVEKASKLVNKKEYKKGLELLEGVADSLPQNVEKDFEARKTVNNYYNLRGLCYKNLGQIDKAIEDYHLAMKWSDSYAALNYIDLLIYKRPDLKKALKAINELDQGFLNEYCLFHMWNYKGYILILMGNKKEAEETYKKILERFAVNEPDKIEKSIKDLNEIVKEKKENHNIAHEILGWFKQKTYDLTSTQIKKNRQWWEGLKEYGNFIQPKLLKKINLKKGEPTDQDIARMFEIKSLYFDDDEPINDVSIFKDFKNLDTLSFHGNVETLEPIKGIKTLKKLIINRDVIKDFKLPFSGKEGKANKLLLEAAGKGDLEGVKKALKDGADIYIKGDFSKTALHKAVFNNHMDIALYLIQQGADIYAQNDDDVTPLLYCSPEDTAKLEDAFKKAGGRKPDESNFMVWDEMQHQKNVCSLEMSPKNVEGNYRIGKGIPLAKEWPKNAHFRMRTDYPGYKRDTKLTDCFLPFYGTIVASKRLKEFLETKKLKNMEYLPVEILDHNGKVASNDFFLIHPINPQDCLDLEKSQPKYNIINEENIEELNRLVIDESRLDPDVQIFRIKNYSKEVIVRKELADELMSQNFGGLAFKSPKR